MFAYVRICSDMFGLRGKKFLDGFRKDGLERPGSGEFTEVTKVTIISEISIGKILTGGDIRSFVIEGTSFFGRTEAKTAKAVGQIAGRILDKNRQPAGLLGQNSGKNEEFRAFFRNTQGNTAGRNEKCG
ncbi:MAG TPA: hypothetical protein VKU37_06400 [Verrucomicrobiae bacterium]|nr:hypothetical protein [Verrucomicrobiae bacterium]